ncbi:MAG: ROK family protein [Deltaproteobacteria bacterium]|nr:MAG: ROK family protein [Deltaproteobacteria bacterium]
MQNPTKGLTEQPKQRTTGESLDSRSQAVIGVDLGGTNTKIGLVDLTGKRLLEFSRVKTLADRGPEAVLSNLSASLMVLMDQAKDKGYLVVGVGVGSAGVIDLNKGVVITSPNLPGWAEFPLGERLRQRLEVPVLVENDVNCICYGEYLFGAGRELGDFLGIALGTGVGGCLIVDGKVWSGGGSSAGEIGHMTIQPQGEQCRCGNRGCLETLASASWLVRRAEKLLRRGTTSSLHQHLEGPRGLSAEKIYRAALAGDQVAQELFQAVGASLAIAVANVVHLLGIRRVLIGGGLANAWKVFIGFLHRELERRLTLMAPPEIRVVKAQLGDNAGALGAAYLVGSRAALEATSDPGK